MPDWLEAISLAQVVVLLAAVGSIGAGLRKVIPSVRKASRLVDQVLGAPGRPGIMDRLESVEQRLVKIEDSSGAAAVQLHKNGGSSVKDQVDTINRKLDRLLGDTP